MKLNNIMKMILVDESGQDLIEYALMAGFVAVAAGAVLPNIATEIERIFSTVLTRLESSGT